MKLTSLLAAGVAACTTALALTCAPAQASSTDTVRLSGADRYGTAAAVSAYVRSVYPGTLYGGTMVTGLNFADGLSAGAAAAANRHTLLLKPSGDLLPTSTLNEAKTLGNLTLVGSDAIMSQRFIDSMSVLSLAPWRVYGRDRYETSLDLWQNGGGWGESDLYVASGENYPDALAGSAVAGHTGNMLVITPPTSLSTWLYLNGGPLAQPAYTNVYVLGSPSAVSDGVLQHIKNLQPQANVVRLQGADRYSTAAAVSRQGYPTGSNEVILVSGRGYADALPAGAMGGLLDRPVLLSDTNCVPKATLDEIKRLGATHFTVVGGPSVLTANVVNRVSCSY